MTTPTIAPMLSGLWSAGVVDGVADCDFFPGEVTVMVGWVVVDVLGKLGVLDVTAGTLPERRGPASFPLSAFAAAKYFGGVTPVMPVRVKRSE